MNHMNMNGLNVGNGATGMPMMTNGTNGGTPRTGSDQDRELDYKARLNTYIYDYLLKQEQYDCARQLLNNTGLTVLTTTKPSPGRRPNGVDEGSMDTDSKDDIDSKRPHDLPLPEIGEISDNNSFLLEWFSLFWDMFFAARKDSKKTSAQAMQYVHHTQQQSRMRQEQQQQFLRQPGMMQNNMQYQTMLRMQQANGMQMNPNDMRQRAQQNLRNMTPQQVMLARNQQQLMQQQQQMERGGSEGDINGQRPRTPSSGDNAASPSKRPRIDGPQFAGQQMMQNGRGPPQGMPAGQRMNMTNPGNQLLMQHGINPSYLNPAQLESFQASNPQVQKKSIQVYAQNMLAQQERQGMPQAGMPNQGSPMMQPGMDGGMPDFYNGNAAMRMVPGGQANGAGNHALQDYQMQLMLLEQQNKKRLLMARQEHDNLNPDGRIMPGQPGFPPGMSPSGSRSGPSPNPSEQMKRGTPKMGQVGLPGSPMPDGSMHPNRGSPAPMNFGQMPPEMLQTAFKMDNGMGVMPNGNMMRPPSSHPQFANGMNPQMEAMRAAQAQNGGRMPNGVNWQQGPQGQAPRMPQVSQPQQPMGTPQQRNMLPPQVPAAGAISNGRPSSPSAPAAPPTPSQSNKAAPKAKKEGTAKETRKRPTKKSSTTAATPSSEAENPPPTPTPSTPITPFNKSTFSDPKNANGQTNGQAPTSVPAPTPVAQQPQQESSLMPPFNAMEIDSSINMTFGQMDTSDVLAEFDFESFLQDQNHHEIDFTQDMNFPDFPMEPGNVES